MRSLLVGLIFGLLFAAGCTPTFIETFPVQPEAIVNHPDTDTRHTWMCVTNVKGTLVGTSPYTRRGQNFVIEAYDRTGDRVEDFLMIYSYTGNGGELFPFPDRYIVQEKDGVYEYVDMQHDGRCQSIVNVIGNPDNGEPGAPVQPRKEYPKQEIMPGQDGESCHEEPANPKEQA